MSDSIERNEKKVNITQLSQWITIATQKSPGFLLKPNDLKMLYILFLWEFLSKYHDKNEQITKDTQIIIYETDVIKMLKLFYDENKYPYFDRLFNI